MLGMPELLWVCLGSAAGGGARHLISEWSLRSLGPAFPYGTLAVNLVGSFLIAVLMYAGLDKELFSPTVRIALTTGLMGGFTTYSTFSYETMRAIQEGAWSTAAANVLVTVLGCLLACFLGWASARWAFGT
jgi:CrcB protein